ncbi:glycosyltransferase family A protein [Xylanimonas ulmi]|uniref:Rhamnosyltransferase n=1 Tax=Xylanimonas ulmi TaxID=228973 RepID=A0A4Q7LXY3_9MICO|nr:glycosyltransferase family 2 protein [Xylanibacterium ulmi]RZS59956.1 rhamnosyltransferase [Xylanibacterium ulmi]
MSEDAVTAAVTATVVIPTYNGEHDHLVETLTAVMAQQAPFSWNVLVIDSGSSDGSVAILERFAAAYDTFRLHQIPNAEFSHGGTRQRAAEMADGEFVVYLSQDAVPADPTWLARMVDGFSLSDRVAGVLGRQVPRRWCFPLQKRDIGLVFAAQGVDGAHTVYDASSLEQGRARYYSDVCSAARRSVLLGDVPYRDVPYAEDQAFGADLIEAGYLKVYADPARVVHSNDIALRDYRRRILDEFAGLEKVGVVLGRPPVRELLRELTGGVARDILFTWRDRTYTAKQRLKFTVTAPLYRYSRWRGKLMAFRREEGQSLEARRKSERGD